MSKTVSDSSLDSSSNSSWTLLEERPDVSAESTESLVDVKRNEENDESDLLSKCSAMLLSQNSNSEGKKKKKNTNEEPINVMYTIFLMAMTVTMFLVALKLPPPENLNMVRPFATQNFTRVTKNDLLSTAINKINESFADEDVCEAEFYNSSLSSLGDFDEGILIEDHETKYEPVKEKQTRFQAVKKLLENPKFQMFLATLIQDLCLIKLVNELTKVTEAEPNKNKKGTVKKTKKKCKTARRKNFQTSSKQLANNVKPLLTEGEVIDKIARIYANKSTAEVDETGQSECEKRFVELDTKWNVLGQNHRQKMQAIRDKFQKKITEIKEKEKETSDRQQKISLTREKFIQRLRADREVYLFNLTKLREERQKLLDDVCHRYRHSRDFSPKDASVGNRALLEPSDFQRKLQKLREQEAVGSGLTKDSPNVDEELEVVMPVRRNKKKSLGQAQDVFFNLRRRYIRRKAKLLRDRRARAERDEVTKTVNNLVDTAVRAATSHGSANIEEQASLNEGLTTTVLKGGSKRNLNLIYDVAFEGQSKRIKQSDFFKWYGNRDNWRVTERGQNMMSKQDPQKMYSAKVLHKGVL